MGRSYGRYPDFVLNPAAKALWYIEAYFHQPLTLPGIAAKVGVSPWYRTGAFGVATGKSWIRYMRERRLTQAARVLTH